MGRAGRGGTLSTVVHELAKGPLAWVRLQQEGGPSPLLLSSLVLQKFIIIVNLMRFSSLGKEIAEHVIETVSRSG